MSDPRPGGLFTAALAVAWCALTCETAFAQTTSASVSGSVKDTQGGVLVGASVSLISETQGTTERAASDSLGSFHFAYVRPDTYTLRIALQDFRTLEQPGLVVNANDRIHAGHFLLAPGGVAETLRVTAPPSDLQLKGGERGFTLQMTTMRSLGVPGRSFFGLALLVPGVTTYVEAPTAVSDFNVNGQRNNSNNVTIDGVANIDTGNNGGNMVRTNLDAIAEFKVLTSSYQAEYGRAIGGQVQVVTRSGSKDFHGSAYWYGRRSGWNENTWLNERDGTPKQQSSRDEQGYTVGGPVYIPGLFNTGKDKLFFFWNQEFQRLKDPVTERRVTVPTDLERRGDFSQSVDASGNPYPYIRDYTTGLPCTAVNTSGCFTYQGVLGRIDPNRLYAPTRAALDLFPVPNVAGQVGYNYKSQEPSKQPLNQSLMRLDFQASATWRLAGRYMWHTNRNQYPYGPPLGSSTVPTVAGVWDVPGYSWLFSTTGVLSNTTSLEISIGSGHNSIGGSTANESLTRASAGMASLPTLFPEAIQDDLAPNFTYGGGRVGNPAAINAAIFAFRNANTTYDIVGSVTKVLGAHTTKAGLYIQRSLKTQSTGNSNGSMSFANDTSNLYDTGHAYANAALGIYQQFQQASAYLVPRWQYSNIEWYLQDNWRVFGNLTLDAGIRFYFLTPQYDTTGMASNWLPEKWNPATVVRLYGPAVVGGTRVGYDAMTGTSVPAALIGRVVPGSGNRFNGSVQAGDGISETLTDGNRFRVSPRAGFAYDITGRQQFVVRGGFAMLYDRPQGNQVFGLINNPPGIEVQTLTWGLAKDIATASSVNPTIALTPSAYAWKVPTVYQWNTGLQMRLPMKVALDVAYVGSHGHDLLQLRNLNAVPYGAAYSADNRDPTRGQSCSGCSAISPVPGGNALPADFMRPYRGYGNINQWGFGAYSNYAALQTTVSRRLSQGLMFSAYYTWSSARGISGADDDRARIDGRDREANYGRVIFDRPHVFVAAFVYQLPEVARRPLGYLANGWQVSGNYRWLHGEPYTASFNIGGGSVSSVNLTGSPTEPARIALSGEPIGRGWSSDPYAQFNIAAFMMPQPGSVGLESPRYTMSRPPARGFDLSISKSVPFGGTRRLEIRLDAFNVLNLVNFTSVNNVIYYRSLTDPTITNLPYDANGNLVNRFGVGTISGVGAPRQLQLMTRFTF